ncbi:phosphate ABC transporter substrate-binding protein PstS [Streptomyces sp. DSM 44917]|uniref:Phosphate-binding protein n=1 Tax=Streptomyces boetiae TaxID=3075541 RepID=A0ABU2L2F0_9ACTN|nr:phosphate ABC transporter substrate-binding protein PstS [Streptomyces sp. DSM 44917]MDT0305438.1 phosphate ABC transporter substrate-binding protein PstS [Streptomyces sp. DSM 44917]
MRIRLTHAAAPRAAAVLPLPRPLRPLAPLAAALALLAAATGCGLAGNDGGSVSRGSLDGRLTGAGATFPEPLFAEWMTYYGEHVETGAGIDYQAVGSGGGIEQFLAGTVDFGSSERYLEESELEVAADVRGCPAVQFPVIFGAVVIAMNDEALDGLILTPEVIAGIYDRSITRYDDPAIAELNPDLALPGEEIVPVHRSDGSGTTFVFTHYLTTEVPSWAENYSAGTDIAWHEDTRGGDGNEGVTRTVRDNPGGLGYVNQSYALSNNLATARVVNADDTPVAPTLAATTAASEEAEIPDDFQFAIDGIGGDGYPITGANWIFAYECGYDEDTAALLRDFWTWTLSDATADQSAAALGYAPMGRALKTRVIEEITRINASG